MVIIDDALLLDVLAGTAAPALTEARNRRQLATTSSWYWRAARAVAGGGRGALSRRIATLPETAREAVRAGMDDLPSEIGLIGFRRLVPIMAHLPRPSNLLTAEAVAVALLLDADIFVCTTSDLLEGVAAAAGAAVRVVTTS